MKNPEVIAYRQRLDSLFKKISSLGGDIEIQSHWAKYLCVLVSGFIESSIQAIYGQYAQEKAHPNVALYVSSRLARFTNPKTNDILDLTGSFSTEWKDKLEILITSELKTAVDSIMANRNQIAHGQSVGISYNRVKDYYDNVVKFIEIVESNCN